MSDEPKVQFEQTLQGAITASLDGPRCAPELRERLLERLARESRRAPEGVQEEDLARFEAALARAVRESAQWAAGDAAVRRVEAALEEETGRDLRSERSVAARLDEANSENILTADPKARYLRALRAAVVRAEGSRKAPPQLRQTVLEAVQRASAVAPAAPSAVASTPPHPAKVVTLVRPRWKRALTAAATLAAGFALFFGTLMGGAEEALAESVRQDHKRCCESLKASEMASCPPFDSAEFGPLPPTQVTSGWTLVASRMCRTAEGAPMVHNVYLRDQATISLHFLPPSAAAKPDSSPRQIAQGEFPVIAWESSGWTVTACSSDLDMRSLASAVGCTSPQ